MKFVFIVSALVLCFGNEATMAGRVPTSRRVVRSPDQVQGDIPNRPQYSGNFSGPPPEHQGSNEAPDLQEREDKASEYNDQGHNEGNSQYTKGQEDFENEESYQETQNDKHNDKANEDYETHKENFETQHDVNSEHYGENNNDEDMEKYEDKGDEEKENVEDESDKLDKYENEGSDNLDKGQNDAESHDIKGDAPSMSYNTDK